MDAAGYPRIRIAGGPRERGLSYGQQAAARVKTSVAAYSKVFEHYAGWRWPRVHAEAIRFLPAIVDYDVRYAEEMRGIAEGAGVAFEDILAINVRTEVMFSAKVREQASSVRRPPLECSAVAALSPFTADGRTLLAQNWDWLVHARDTVIVLEVQQDEGPAFVTVVEAGLLAKCGLNSNGVGIVTNALVADTDRGEPRLPYHVVLRSLFDAGSLSDALARIQRTTRSSSANYLVAQSGAALNVEAVPGDFSDLAVDIPSGGLFVHTNHFLSPRFTGRDVGLWVMPDSPVRYQRFLTRLEEFRGSLTPEALRRCLADHVNHPAGVCAHPREGLDPVDQDATLASVVMDLDERAIWIADGPPCCTPYGPAAYASLARDRA